MTITQTFDPPLPTDSTSAFNSKAFAFVSGLNVWSQQANSTAASISEAAQVARESAATSAIDVELAEQASAAAAAAAATALASPGTSATSSSLMVIGLGSKTFLIQPNKSIVPGQFVVVSRTGSAGLYMHGQVIDHVASTGSITVNVTSTRGSGSYSGWTVALSAPGGLSADQSGLLTVPGVFAKYTLDGCVVVANASGALQLDLSEASIFDLNLTGNITSAQLASVPLQPDSELLFVVRITQGAVAYALTWFPGITWLTSGGLPPSTPAAGKTVEYIFSSKSGGGYYGRKGAEK